MTETKTPSDSAEGSPEAIRARLLAARGYGQMMDQAYDALLHHNVNYRNLPEFKDQRLVEEAAKLPPPRSADRYLLWMERLTNAIRAAVRRAGFKRIDNDVT